VPGLLAKATWTKPDRFARSTAVLLIIEAGLSWLWLPYARQGNAWTKPSDGESCDTWVANRG
jgi:hypothetical protein